MDNTWFLIPDFLPVDGKDIVNKEWIFLTFDDTGNYWPLHCADLVPRAFPVTFQPTCPEPNDSEESEESEDEGMEEGANIDVPAGIVLNLIQQKWFSAEH